MRGSRASVLDTGEKGKELTEMRERTEVPSSSQAKQVQAMRPGTRRQEIPPDRVGLERARNVVSGVS